MVPRQGGGEAPGSTTVPRRGSSSFSHAFCLPEGQVKPARRAGEATGKVGLHKAKMQLRTHRGMKVMGTLEHECHKHAFSLVLDVPLGLFWPVRGSILP